MRYISLFLSKLFPELTKKEREKELFYILYGSKKSFREYVKSIIKVEVLPEMRKAICQEIKKTLCCLEIPCGDGLFQSVFESGKLPFLLIIHV